jgi:hypothetical protein
MFFMCPNLTDVSPSLIHRGRLVLAAAWLLLLVSFSAAMPQTTLGLFSLSKSIFVGATSLVLQQQPSQVLHDTQPSSRTF